jgi:hypothetical protein
MKTTVEQRKRRVGEPRRRQEIEPEKHRLNKVRDAVFKATKQPVEDWALVAELENILNVR